MKTKSVIIKCSENEMLMYKHYAKLTGNSISDMFRIALGFYLSIGWHKDLEKPFRKED